VQHRAWHGPGRKDRLDLKVDHLLSKQLLLSTHPVAKAALDRRGIVIDDRAVILKGRLFYPWRQRGPDFYPLSANPSHLGGSWLTLPQVLHHFGADAVVLPLVRSGWMAGVPVPDASETYTVSELVQLVNRGRYRLPLHVARLLGEMPMERLFIVDDDWAAA